jgi:alpha-galactosidase
MKAILGMGDLVTNVNLPNYGQIPNLPLGAIVETNARFTAGGVTPVFAGNVPNGVAGLVGAAAANQRLISEAARTKTLSPAFAAFVNDPLNTISPRDSKQLFRAMVEQTKRYLTMYRFDYDTVGGL